MIKKIKKSKHGASIILINSGTIFSNFWL